MTSPCKAGNRTLGGTNAFGTTNTFAGTTYSNSGGSLTVTSTTAGAILAFTNANAIDLKETTVIFNGAGNTNVSGAIYNSVNAGSVTKDGTGTLTFSGGNSYDGATAVNGGTLVAANAAALGTTTAGTTVASGATLDVQASLAAEAISVGGTGVGGLGALVTSTGTGTVAGLVTLSGNASIGGAGTLNVSGGLAGAFTVTKVGAGTTHLSGPHTFSTLTTSAGTTNVDSALAATSTVNANATTNFTVSQKFGALNIGTVPLANPLAAFSGSEVGTHLGVAAVPEPGSIGLLLIGALGLASRRRRNS